MCLPVHGENLDGVGKIISKYRSLSGNISMHRFSRSRPQNDLFNQRRRSCGYPKQSHDIPAYLVVNWANYHGNRHSPIFNGEITRLWDIRNPIFTVGTGSKNGTMTAPEHSDDVTGMSALWKSWPPQMTGEIHIRNLQLCERWSFKQMLHSNRCFI